MQTLTTTAEEIAELQAAGTPLELPEVAAVFGSAYAEKTGREIEAAGRQAVCEARDALEAAKLEALQVAYDAACRGSRAATFAAILATSNANRTATTKDAQRARNAYAADVAAYANKIAARDALQVA